MSKAETAVAFHRKLIEAEIVHLTPSLKEKLSSCEQMLTAGALGTSLSDSFAVFVDPLCHSPARATPTMEVTSENAQEGQADHQSQTRLPPDVLSLILDQVPRYRDQSRVKSTLSSLALCDKAFHSLAQPRLIGEVKLNTVAKLLHFVYALNLQPKESEAPLLVREVQLDWNFPDLGFNIGAEGAQLSYHRLNRMVLSMCPSVTSLSLEWNFADMYQSDVDALDGFLRLTTQLESLTLDVSGFSVSTYGAEDVTISQQTGKSRSIFRKTTTDRPRQLRFLSLSEPKLHFMTRRGAGIWPIFVHRLGPDLRRIELCNMVLVPEQLQQLSTCSPHLEEVLFECELRCSYIDISSFIEAVGPSLPRLVLFSVLPPGFAAETPSLVFESLARFGHRIESFQFSTRSGLSREDLQVLADPGCLPCLKTLVIVRSHSNCDTAEERKIVDAHSYEETLAAILDSHKTTLQSSIAFQCGDLQLGDVFL